MYVGRPTLCLKVSNLAESKRFYQALGFEVFDESELRVALRRGGFSLALMTFLDQDVLNFRGEDAFEIQKQLERRGVKLPGQPERYRKAQLDADADGSCWSTVDPDGHVILFDTNENEIGPAAKQRQLSQLLKNTEQDLVDLGADDECLAAFREHVSSKFALPKD